MDRLRRLAVPYCLFSLIDRDVEKLMAVRGASLTMKRSMSSVGGICLTLWAIARGRCIRFVLNPCITTSGRETDCVCLQNVRSSLPFALR